MAFVPLPDGTHVWCVRRSDRERQIRGKSHVVVFDEDVRFGRVEIPPEDLSRFACILDNHPGMEVGSDEDVDRTFSQNLNCIVYRFGARASLLSSCHYDCLLVRVAPSLAPSRIYS